MTSVARGEVVTGDCLEILPGLDAGKFQAVITDPPYGIALDHMDCPRSRHGRQHKKISGKGLMVAGDGCLTATLAMADWADHNSLCLTMFGSPFRPIPGDWTSVLAWDKGPQTGVGGDYRLSWKRTFEMIFVRNNRVMNGGRDQAVLKFYRRPDEREHHVCQKPVDLMRYLVRKLTNPGDTVLDPFCGSGSTLVACIVEGRNCVGIELDPAVAEAARGRVSEARAAVKFGRRASLTGARG